LYEEYKFIFFLNIFSHDFRAVRNLHQLVLRQQKVEKEEEIDEVEDPIKRVRQQLDKVKEFFYIYIFLYFFLFKVHVFIHDFTAITNEMRRFEQAKARIS